MPLSPGAVFERYEIESLVGRGGMGEVYRARDTRLRRNVALKVMRADKRDPAQNTERLFREARSAAALNHPNSVAIYDLGEAEGIPFIAMELVIGTSFKETVKREAKTKTRVVTIDTKVRWLVDTARALHAAHRAGLVHRDVKPSNVMVSEDGVVKVLDFGLAKPVVRRDPTVYQTEVGKQLGTPKYMAPELLDGRPPSPRTDQYSFGITAYELLSGEYADGALAGNVKPLEELVPEASAELSHVIAKTLDLDPDRRFASMEAVAKELSACIDGLGAVARDDVTIRQPPPPQRAAHEEEQKRTAPIAAPIPNKTVRLSSAVAAGAITRGAAPAPVTANVTDSSAFNRRPAMFAPQPSLPAPAPPAPAPAPDAGTRRLVLTVVVALVVTTAIGVIAGFALR